MYKSFDRFFVYTILSLKDLSIYTDITSDLKTRINEHMRGIVIGTNIKIPFKLIHYEYFVNLEDAKNRLMYLKSNSGRAYLKDSLKRTLATKKYMPYKIR